jgi:transcriptional regulator NrdR family protein
MQCPQCGHSTSLVLDTRSSEQLVRRRCTNCEFWGINIESLNGADFGE